MEQYFIVVPIILSSTCAIVLSKRACRSWKGLMVAAAKMLECVGATVIFLAANILAAIAVIFALRLLAGGRAYVSLYLANDVILLVLSLLQAMAFQWWREAARQRK